MTETPRKRFSPEQVSAAVKLIKSKRPDLWERWRYAESHEVRDETVIYEIIPILNTLEITANLPEKNELLWEMRLALRRELGLWVGNEKH